MGMQRYKHFPKFEFQSYEGQNISNEYFKEKTTIVVFQHLGCPPAMWLMSDLEEYRTRMDTSKVQILVFTENTKSQIEEFYNDSTSIMHRVRSIFNTPIVHYPIIPLCKKEKTKINKDGSISIRSNCRHMSWKLRSFSSPTILVVNSDGKIVKKQKGYTPSDDLEYRLSTIDALLDD